MTTTVLSFVGYPLVVELVGVWRVIGRREEGGTSWIFRTPKIFPMYRTQLFVTCSLGTRLQTISIHEN